MENNKKESYMRLLYILKSIFLFVSLSTVTYAAELVDAGFENPVLGVTPPTPIDDWGTAAAYHEDDVPGWLTTDDVTNGIEIWSSASGVAAYEGNQFAEINAYNIASLYQDIVTVPGSTVNWYIAHRGRSGTDVAQLSMGVPGGSMTTEATMSDGNTAWGAYSGTYTIPAGQTVTRFELVAVSSVGGDSYGNFVDAFRIEGGGVIAYPNSYTTYIDGSLSGNAITDGPADYGQPLTIDSFTNTSNGTLTVIAIGGDGSFTYTPDPGFEGADTFTYTIADGYGGFSTETVTVNVVPEVANDDVISTDYEIAVSGNVLTNDVVAPGVNLSSFSTSSNGTITIDDAAAGTFTYTPNSGFSGTDTFTYTLSNGLSANLTIFVEAAPIVLPVNLVAEYRMDECGFDGTAGDVIDNTINRLNGTSSGDASISIVKQDNKICSAAVFDGNGDAVTVGNNTDLSQSGTDTITVSFWINLNGVDASDDDVVLGMYDSDSDRDKGWGFNFSNDSNRLDFFVGTRNGRYYEARNTISNIGWHHIVGVYAGNNVSIYIDNVKTTGNDASGWWGSNIRATNGDLTIGGSPNFGTDFAGQIDEVKIFSTALTAVQVTSMYNNENAGRNWNEDTDSRKCKTCQCTAAAGSNMVSFPADFRNMTSGKDVDTMLGTDFTGTYGTDWELARRDYDIVTDNKNDAFYTPLLDSDVLQYGKAYWIANRTGAPINYEANLKTMDFDATVTDYPSCRSANGKCALIDLQVPNGTDNNGPYIYNMTSFAVQKSIRWEDVRVLITDGGTTTSYTPDQAAALEETFNATIWRYDQDGTNYTNVTPGTPGINNTIDPCSGYWIELDKNTAGKTVQLLIPEE